MLKCLLRDAEIIYHLDFELEQSEEELSSHGCAANLGAALKEVLRQYLKERLTPAETGGNPLFPPVQPTHLKPPQTVSGSKMRGSG